MAQRFRFDVADFGKTTAIVYRAPSPIEATLILAHGAGAPQTHPFLVDVAKLLAARGVDVVTFDFLYADRGKRMPDRNDVLEATWRAAIASVRARGGLPTERLFCGGKSMGGRIASQVAAEGDGASLAGLVFLGYPLHPASRLRRIRGTQGRESSPPDKPKTRRDEHLPRVPFPMLFVQGERDPFGTAREIRALAKRLPSARAFIVAGGDHSLSVGRKKPELGPVADAIATFVREA